ncbi:MAG: IS481 family transposase [Nitrososphaerota archaeon]|jgi:putative transposase|nr:IS481 family transposase [Nitrososphaerota archaeon]
MVKLGNRKKLKWCLREFEQRKASQTWIANYLGITPRRFRQIYRFYKKTNTIPQIGLNVGRPKTQILNKHKQIVLDQWSKHRFNALYLESIIAHEEKTKIPHNTIHRIMLEYGLANTQENKQKRRKPWIRYEREHSLSAVHMDWHVSKAVLGMQVCVVLDDASRKFLSAGEFCNATAENSCLLLKQALDDCRSTYNISIRECICDHGTQFYGVRRDKAGCADHTFEVFLFKEEIKQILCGVNHPQTNGGRGGIRAVCAFAPIIG